MSLRKVTNTTKIRVPWTECEPAKEFGQYWNSRLVRKLGAGNKEEKIRSGKRAQSEAFGKRSHPIIGQLRFGLL